MWAVDKALRATAFAFYAIGFVFYAMSIPFWYVGRTLDNWRDK